MRKGRCVHGNCNLAGTSGSLWHPGSCHGGAGLPVVYGWLPGRPDCRSVWCRLAGAGWCVPGGVGPAFGLPQALGAPVCDAADHGHQCRQCHRQGRRGHRGCGQHRGPGRREGGRRGLDCPQLHRAAHPRRHSGSGGSDRRCQAFLSPRRRFPPCKRQYKNWR